MALGPSLSGSMMSVTMKSRSTLDPAAGRDQIDVERALAEIRAGRPRGRAGQ